MYKVLIVEDSRDILKLLGGFRLWDELDMEIAALVDDRGKALQYIRENKIDIVITSIKDKSEEEYQFCKDIKRINSYHKVIFISPHREFACAKRAITVSADGYVLTDNINEELADILVLLKTKLEREYRHFDENVDREFFRN